MMEGGSDISSRSRRDFLKNVGAGLVGSSILGSSVVSAAGKYDNMELLKHYLPPGILNCRDRAIRILYAQEISGLWNNDFPQVSDRMSSRYDGYFDSVIVNPSSRHLEPAWYMLREQLNYKKGYSGGTEINYKKGYPGGRGIRSGNIVPNVPLSHIPQMLAFDEGITQWFNAHKRDYKSAIPKTEDRLFHSISYAAYDDEQTAEEKAAKYLNSDIDGKTGIVLDIRKKFEEMGKGSRESTDPRDPYNRKLVAAWSSFKLGSHYWNIQNKTRGELDDLVYEQIEMSLREQNSEFKVRGPPQYKWG